MKFQKRPKDKKKSDAKSERSNEPRQPQKYTPLGKIDLDSLGKKPSAQSAASTAKPDNKKAKASAVSQPKENKPKEHAAENKPAEKPVAQTAAPQPAAKPEQHSEKPQSAEKPAVAQTAPAAPQQKPQPAAAPAEKEQKPQSAAPQTETKESQDSKVFTLKSEKKLAPKVNVLGKIDLDALNQSTRPKKKSKEERRKEREEKAHNGNGNAGGERKKRQRITKERVDIAAAAKQNNGQQGQKNAGGSNKKKNRKRGGQKPAEVSEEDVARQVKETLARLTSKGQNKKGAKYRKEKRDAVQEHLKEQRAEEKAESKILKLTEFVTVSELANMMNVSVNQVIGTCMSVGIMVSINQRLDAETINLVAEEFGFKTEYVSAEVSEAINEEPDDENDLVPRAPIVTVMGHVDHGKTSLLDHIRNTNVIAGEAGGITQHIGAYNVTLQNGRHITFLDTPGHEAFTAMRARGAQVTDIAIIIVAADDSVMPTTREAIAHAQAANVPMVFAINKIDKPGANPDKIREDLANMNLLVEEWGGKYQCQEISAKKGIGVEDLLEKVLLEADMLEL